MNLLLNIAESHALLGKYREAKLMYRQTLDQRKKVLGEKHPYTLGSRTNLAVVLEQQEKYKDARQIAAGAIMN